VTVPRSFIDLLDSFAEGWRPNAGDKLTGVVIGLETRTTEYGEYPIVTVRTDDGTDFAFHAFHTVAKRELEKLQPRVGDWIGIAYHGPHTTKGYERYRIIITRDTGGATIDNPTRQTPPDQDATSGNDDDVPF
jgi:hypothetical protein